jgi:hypothetical protein
MGKARELYRRPYSLITKKQLKHNFWRLNIPQAMIKLSKTMENIEKDMAKDLNQTRRWGCSGWTEEGTTAGS